VGVIQHHLGGGLKRHNGGEIRGRARGGGGVSHSRELLGGDWRMMEEHLRSCMKYS